MRMRTWTLGAAVAALCAVLVSCTGDISQEAFDQINVGMSIREVEDIMGAPGEKQDNTEMSISSGGVLGSTQSRNEVYLWTSTDRKREIGVEFRDAKVVSKSKRGF